MNKNLNKKAEKIKKIVEEYKKESAKLMKQREKILLKISEREDELKLQDLKNKLKNMNKEKQPSVSSK